MSDPEQVAREMAEILERKRAGTVSTEDVVRLELLKAADDDNVIPFTLRPLPENDPLFGAAATVLDWVSQMQREGRCPSDVLKAFSVLFENLS